MTCPDIDRLTDYKGPGLDAELDEHLAECQDCRETVEVLLALSAALEPMVAVRPELVAKTMARIDALATKRSWRSRAATFVLSLLTFSPFSAATYSGGGLAVPAAIAVAFAAVATLLEPRFVAAR